MAKKRERSELEYLRGENRELRKRLRHYEKRLKYFEKRSHFHDENETTESEEIDTIISCPYCGKGSMELKDFGFIQLFVCNLCKFRKKLHD